MKLSIRETEEYGLPGYVCDYEPHKWVAVTIGVRQDGTYINCYYCEERAGVIEGNVQVNRGLEEKLGKVSIEEARERAIEMLKDTVSNVVNGAEFD